MSICSLSYIGGIKMTNQDDKTVEELKKEIDETVKKIVGNINNLDSKKDKADVVLSVLNDVIAGVELSKIEKAGTLIYLMNNRVK